MPNRLQTGRQKRGSSEPEEFTDFRRFMEVVNRTVHPYPQLDEGDIHDEDSRPTPPAEAHRERDSVRVVAWGFTIAVGAVTVFGIATGDHAILKGVLALAGAWMLRLITRPAGAGDDHGSKTSDDKRKKRDRGSRWRFSGQDPGDP